MRLFVAFEIPDRVRGGIAGRADALRASLPPARWVRGDQLHLTLVFLGEVEERRLSEIEAALAPVFAATSTLRLRLGESGTFPPERPARVAWIGVEAEQDLPALERRVRAALEDVLGRAGRVVGGTGPGVEERPYHTHVTLARPRRPGGRAAIAAFRQGLAGLTGEWAEPRAVLMESRLGGSGSRYEVRQAYPLAEESP
ncbi:MAG TPA: RNA 2',3'-cyclic phosphodiesterase [Thermoanaerobaculia bacterium]|nr:RNA 2',3'-cyclic phosphodiesterase [Thermoanaerobaculia bacterium]